jgi:hypothetical protein
MSSNLSSHPLPADTGNSDDGEGLEHKEEDVEIKVTQAPGYLWALLDQLPF